MKPINKAEAAVRMAVITRRMQELEVPFQLETVRSCIKFSMTRNATHIVWRNLEHVSVVPRTIKKILSTKPPKKK
mgnify:FL=1